MRSGVWHCSARPSHQRSISVADPRGIGVSSFSACRRALGAFPAGLLILYLNFRLYGSALTTGYGSPIQILQAFHSDPTQLFSIFYLRPHLTNFTYWIVLYLGPLVISALALPFFRHARNREWAMQAVWIVVLTGFYASYQPSGDAWHYIRFLLPGLPQLVLLAVGGLSSIWQDLEGGYRPPVKRLPPFHRLRQRSPLFKGLGICAMVMLSIVWTSVATYRLSVLSIAEHERIYPDTAQWAVHHLPANALIWSSGMSGTIYYHTHFPILRFDSIDEAKVRAFFKAADAGQHPVYAVVWPYEISQLTRHLGGSWTKVGELGTQRISVLEFVR